MATTANCQHHWLIETPRGATSPGHCKHCGAEREFTNYEPVPLNRPTPPDVRQRQAVLREEGKLRQVIEQLRPFY